MKNFWYSSLFVFCCFQSSCQQDVSIISRDFPNNTGDTWVYLVTDSLLQKSYSMTVTVMGETQIAGGKNAKMWLFDLPTRKDTNFVVEEDNHIYFYFNRYENAPIIRRFDFPMKTGDQWIGSITSDVTRITEQRDINTIAGSFTKALFVNRTIPLLANYRLQENTWFKPGIGILKLYRNEYDLGPPAVQTWELQSYKFSKR